MWFQDVVTVLLGKTSYYKKLVRRTMVLEVGFSGYVTDFDKLTAKNENLKPLNKLEKKFVSPIVKIFQKQRREVFKQALDN